MGHKSVIPLQSTLFYIEYLDEFTLCKYPPLLWEKSLKFAQTGIFLYDILAL